MTEIPDAWPIEPAPQVFHDVPMFPLPDVFLFPGQVLPLHVFEPRYRQMVEDLLDGPGRLVMATVRDEQREMLAGNPDVLPVAGLGSIERHERTADGRFMIWLVGRARVRIRETPSDRLYRTVACEPIVEPAIDDDDARELREPLVDAIQARAGREIRFTDDVPIGVLADVLAHVLQMPQSAMAKIFAEPDPASRARAALAVYERSRET